MAFSQFRACRKRFPGDETWKKADSGLPTGLADFSEKIS
jgi:hypothetical protein